MMRNLVLGLLIPLATGIALDWLWVRRGEPVALGALVGLSAVVVLVITPWLTFRALHRARAHLGLVGAVLLTVLLSLSWYLIALVVFMNVHMAFGGSH